MPLGSLLVLADLRKMVLLSCTTGGPVTYGCLGSLWRGYPAAFQVSQLFQHLATLLLVSQVPLLICDEASALIPTHPRDLGFSDSGSQSLPLRQGSASPRPQLLIHLGLFLCIGAVSPLSPQGLGPLPAGPSLPPRLALAADPS